ncbi:hypothetical protein FNE76_02595 [Helicobacter mehlei]|uniref:DUF177 domain-containing protein n=2 Tax=Helicobacter mehlei TaxID=2316080 RepID=A0A553V0M0_9HELI|nr:hypothetical protein [Helicobacter mehlei]TSA85992.1 hypothetical protein FNE76_02595 [Helicobacter mehlei]
MRLEMRKIGMRAKPFTCQLERIELEGLVSRVGSKLYLLEGHLHGVLSVPCALSGTIFDKPISQDLRLLISDGIYKPAKAQEPIYLENGFCMETMDVVESLDGCIDLEALLDSEMQSIQADYHYLPNS